MTPRKTPPLASLILLGGLFALCACATTSASARKYPARRPGCKLAVYATAAPPLDAWDDIGIAQISCYLDEGEVACLHRLRTEACRMGGDIIYNVPARISRPREREMTIRAQVAHTRAPAPGKTEEVPPPAAANEPIVPIGAPVPSASPPPLPALAADGGAGGGDARDDATK
jgi:hypothetical protein